ncbi:MAG: hypothetical protein AAF604_07405 [Acidobacteriota bacterium]
MAGRAPAAARRRNAVEAMAEAVPAAEPAAGGVGGGPPAGFAESRRQGAKLGIEARLLVVQDLVAPGLETGEQGRQAGGSPRRRGDGAAGPVGLLTKGLEIGSGGADGVGTQAVQGDQDHRTASRRLHRLDTDRTGRQQGQRQEAGEAAHSSRRW